MFLSLFLTGNWLTIFKSNQCDNAPTESGRPQNARGYRPRFRQVLLLCGGPHEDGLGKG